MKRASPWVPRLALGTWVWVRVAVAAGVVAGWRGVGAGRVTGVDARRERGSRPLGRGERTAGGDGRVARGRRGAVGGVAADAIRVLGGRAGVRCAAGPARARTAEFIGRAADQTDR